MATYSLTSGDDVIPGTSGDDTVNATASTLNPGDSLTGGSGSDTLALVGSGTFRIDQLATFSGFETVSLNNATSLTASVYLDNGAHSVSASGFGRWFLGNGAVAFQGTGSADQYLYTYGSWNGASTFSFSGYGLLYFQTAGAFDLTGNSFSNLYQLYTGSSNLTLKISSSAAAGIQNITNASGSNDVLTTADATLDLTHSTVSGFSVTSTNATGTTFTVATRSSASKT